MPESMEDEGSLKKIKEKKADKEKEKEQDLNILQKQHRLMELFMMEERNVLMRIETAIEKGEVVHPSQIKIWRSEIRIPVFLQNVKLTDEQKQEVEKNYNDQVDYFKKRAMRMIEEGSQYSSDYEEMEESEYITTDGEGENKEQILKQTNLAGTNVKVLRGNTLKMQKKMGEGTASHTDKNWNQQNPIERAEHLRKSMNVEG